MAAKLISQFSGVWQIATRRSLGLLAPVNFKTVVALFIVSGFANDATAESVDPGVALSVKPDKCISLRRGLVCYQRIRFDWSVGEAGDYCLIEASASSPLVCWTQLSAGHYVSEFASSESKSYHLIKKSNSQQVGAVTMQVAWIYRSKKRSRGRWRLF